MNQNGAVVGPLFLFELASSQARWLELRQSTIATNVANANTPGFKARDVEPFNKVLDAVPVRLATTSPAHMQLSPAETDTRATAKKDSWDVVHSGNSVSLEQEMIKGSDVNRDYSMNSAIVRSFNRMVLTSAKT
ncbi:flagellar basal body rod protein FlgB [Bradyrhizobium sp. WYCCWR 13023]|uniref:Flagellar basal body rod protein FlgB n=1 Tax=Bradyrhizobium zhengyangense TaxID=2911009 RepID=A0A9X1UI62_9BRAD|nr:MULTISPECIES: flagellar basal body rod protein FlgB [Bradyrhizobium]MCG2629252.1 flagellar basal body rod protein FlgB [Bradyrhizobium zhengyangense]MCG2640765.1 flagellar basal body rod protein FlgB [Bradyrhizobium zhengyangense]MCG2670599.1 flagellar basal body rod protein FlgB [Bradyrhizobium zhengyangense]MDA9518928.1 flagellar basal body rod protein FlgB [Bradyrhizobium sp. CCBAU 11434]